MRDGEATHGKCDETSFTEVFVRIDPLIARSSMASPLRRVAACWEYRTCRKILPPVTEM